jgi:hypothetical protein
VPLRLLFSLHVFLCHIWRRKFCFHNLNGYLHWSATPTAHRQIAHHITPALNERSFVWYLVRTYFLGVFIPTFKGLD